MDTTEIVKDTSALLRKYLGAMFSDFTGDLKEYTQRLATGIVTYAELKVAGESARAGTQLKHLRAAARNIGTIVAVREARRWQEAVKEAIELAAKIAMTFLMAAVKST